jgi:hypothetical protein
MNQRVVCQRCKHYFVTWEKNKPHGCKAYGFKSRLMPSAVVFQSSGIACSFYQQRIRKN